MVPEEIRLDARGLALAAAVLDTAANVAMLLALQASMLSLGLLASAAAGTWPLR